jgi:hypothetical protein
MPDRSLVTSNESYAIRDGSVGDARVFGVAGGDVGCRGGAGKERTAGGV